MKQLVAYNGNKRKRRRKYKVSTAPYGLILHAYELIEDKRYDWNLYVRSELGERLSETMHIG